MEGEGLVQHFNWPSSRFNGFFNQEVNARPMGLIDMTIMVLM